MTTKDYIKLADALARAKPNRYNHSDGLEYHVKLNTWLDCRHEIMSVLQSDNPNFNSTKFIEATEQPTSPSPSHLTTQPTRGIIYPVRNPT